MRVYTKRRRDIFSEFTQSTQKTRDFSVNTVSDSGQQYLNFLSTRPLAHRFSHTVNKAAFSSHLSSLLSLDLIYNTSLTGHISGHPAAHEAVEKGKGQKSEEKRESVAGIKISTRRFDTSLLPP